MRALTLPFLLLAACSQAAPQPDSATPEDEGVAWRGSLPERLPTLGATRGLSPRRTIAHLHSPYSHDACDGQGLIEGAPDEACLADLRAGLCATATDIAFLTDHPSHAAAQPFEDLLLQRGQDELVLDSSGQAVANLVVCEGEFAGRKVLWLPGIEDDLMPVSLDAHASDSAEVNDALYSDDSAETIEALQALGATVLTAHTEGRTLEELQRRQADGLQGTELFNLHAMFDPGIRGDDLGLDPMGWLTAIGPFTDPGGTAEPDLLLLAVLQEQTPSIERWDALQSEGLVVGTAGTDAHQNTIPTILRDGERGDSYRRMLFWFSNVLLVDDQGQAPSPTQAQAALEAGRLYVAFDLLGVPEGFDFFLRTDQGEAVEMGGEGEPGTLELACPQLSEDSPRTKGLWPDVHATIFKDGQVFAEGCGSHAAPEPGIYRVRVDITPNHLRGFLGEEPDAWLGRYPWVYSNPVRVRAPATRR